jgi:hypothetical protein
MSVVESTVAIVEWSLIDLSVTFLMPIVGDSLPQSMSCPAEQHDKHTIGHTFRDLSNTSVIIDVSLAKISRL